MHHPCHRGLSAGLDIGCSARDRAGRGQAAKQDRTEIGNALADQFLVRPVPGPGHAIRYDCRKQRFDASEKGDRECSRQQFGDFCPGQIRQGRCRQPGRHIGKPCADRFDRQLQQCNRQRRQHNRNQKSRQSGSEFFQCNNHAKCTKADQKSRDMHRGHRSKISLPLGQEPGRHILERKSQKILNLTRRDDESDPGRKARDHRMRNELDQSADPERSGRDQDESSQECGDEQAIIAMFGNHVEDDHDKGPGGTTDLDPRPAEERDQKSSDYSCDQPLVGRCAAGDGQCHGQGQRNDRHRQTGDRVRSEQTKIIALTHGGDEFGCKALHGAALAIRPPASPGRTISTRRCAPACHPSFRANARRARYRCSRHFRQSIQSRSLQER